MASMKGNDGRAARRHLLRRLGLVLGTFGVCLSILVLLGVGGGRFRQRKRRFALFDMGFRSQSEKKQQHAFKLDTTPLIANEQQVEQMILEASLHLVDLEVDYEELAYSPSDAYAGIYGRFCPLNFAAHKKNPTAVPMFRDLVDASPDCQKVYWKMDLQRIATLARDHDRQQQPTNKVHVLNLTAVVFHESRCGSTLVANSLMAMNPDEHRVYSESSPPIAALRLCGDLFENCRVDQAVRVLQDTLYLMGRSNDPKETRVFYKIQSVGTRYVNVFLQAFPTTPWLFVYRDPVQVMMSHLGVGDNMAYANCVRQYNQPPPSVIEILQRRLDNTHELQDVSYEDYCAAYLASLTERAVEALRTSKYGHAIHYPDLPQLLYQDTLPNKLGVALNDQQIGRIIHVSSQYSKGRSGQGGQWHEDSKQKDRRASQSIKAAARLFLENSYNELVKMSQSDKRDGGSE